MTHDERVPVLLVDDRPANLIALEAILGSKDYALVSVGSGDDALAQVKAHDFAVVLLDVQMPGMDGFAVAMQLKEIAKPRRPLPLIFVTGIDGAPSRILRAYAEAGAVDFIQKPLDTSVLRAKVAVFAELYRARRQLAQQQERADRALRALGDLALALAGARTPGEMAAVIVDVGMRTAGADTCTVYLLDESGTELALLGHRGVAPEIVDRIQLLTAAEWPGVFARLDVPAITWVETGKQYAERQPAIAAMHANGPRAHAYWCLPLIAEGSSIGLLGMGFYAERRFPPEEHTLIETLGTQCAQALLRAVRLDREERTRARLSTVLRSIGDAVIATDAAAHVTFMNSVAEQLTGWTEAEARDRGIDDVFMLFAEDTRARRESPVTAALREQTVQSLGTATFLRSRAGVEIPIDDSASPIFDARLGGRGGALGVVLVFRDVTAQKREQVRRDFLARAGSALASSLDYRATLVAVAQLAVPQLADWCAIDLLEPDQETATQVAAAYAGPGVANDDARLRALVAQRPESSMVVPLRGRLRTLGAMTFVYDTSGRRYDARDLAFAEEFARRAAMAIENALAIKQAEEAQVQLRRATDAALHASEARFHHLVDAVTDYAIFMLDRAGQVATWNAGARRAKGYEPHEVIGQHFSIFYTPEDRDVGRPETILDVVRREGRFEEEGWRVRKDGTRFWAHVVITALREPNGEISGFAKVTRDLSAKRSAEENQRELVREQFARAASDAERQRLLTLLKQVPAIINYLRGPDLVFEFAHPRTLERMGRELLGRPLLVAAPELREGPHYARLRRVYETGDPVTQIEGLVWFEVDGRRVQTYWNSFYLPVRNAQGIVDGVMTFDLDVTENVRARRELEQANRAKDEFLATVSHELRTPLNAISGWASMLQRKPLDADRLARGLEVIERNAKAQTRLISDLLDVSRIISGKLQLTLVKTEILPVVVAASDVVRPAAEAKGVRLDLDVTPDIGATMADADRLQQIIWNLLSNAVRFTPRGGRVTIAAERNAQGITITVQDTGAGIAEEHLPHIFERFKQVDSSTTRAHGGLGLGLAIVRHLVEAHGGSVVAGSPGLGHGATFTIQLPIHAMSPERSELEPERAVESGDADPDPASTDLHGVRVLVVDDNADSLDVLRMVLETAGATVKTATSALAAFEAWDTQRGFDLVISDISMPDIDGYSFMRTFRARASGTDVPAIALTASARAEDAALAKRAGFQEHLAKPVDERRLLEAVRAWATQARIAKES
ncbi:MAG TPA: response regulator [Polyangiaceae bacterium]|nr:response regulator [Polyangiaceae bacterium]